MRLSALLILALLLLPLAHAEDGALTRADRALIEHEVRDFFNGTQPTVIMGAKLSLLEKGLFRSLFAADPELQTYRIRSERNVTRQALQNDLVLLGGAATNSYAAFPAPPEKELAANPLRLSFHSLANGTRALVISTTREEQNYPYTGIAKSPLAGLLPAPLVPVAASLASILLLLLGQLLLKLAKGMGKDIAALRITSWWKARFADKQAKRHLRIRSAQVPVRELVTVLGSIVLVGLASAWLYSGDYLAVLCSTLPASATVGLFRFLARKWYCHHNEMHIEAILWPLGTVATLVSVLLGNLFSLTSYWRTHWDERKRSSAHSWFLAVATMALGLAAWLANLFWPSHYLQLLAVLGATIPFIDLFPIPPLVGWSLWKWQKTRWILTFGAALPLYLLIVFAGQIFA